ncbi:hypothetical protein ABT324_28050 [Saccharopolyspora sp. NPDC000359]|uniref:hypothetical protein n=1 Tax=Saccharopolyspora sp. NPDC000359 TaxID=3154251 RepID=UPI00332AC829
MGAEAARRGRRAAGADTPRRRVTVANKTLARVAAQRARLSSGFAKARTDRERLAVLCDALRAASAPGSHQPPGTQPSFGPLLAALRTAVAELHQAQEKHARRVLDIEARARRRRERKEAA